MQALGQRQGRRETPLRPDVSRLRSLQADQRQPRACGRRRVPDRRVAAHPAPIAPDRHRRAPGRRRVCDPGRGHRLRELCGGAGRASDAGTAPAVPDRGHRDQHQREHRHHLQRHGLRDAGRHAARRRYRDVQGQVERQGKVCTVRHRTAYRGLAPPAPGGRPAPRVGDRAALGGLPAAVRPDFRRHHRLRGAGALEPRRTRHGQPGKLHRHRRGRRTDHADHRFRAAQRVPCSSGSGNCSTARSPISTCTSMSRATMSHTPGSSRA